MSVFTSVIIVLLVLLIACFLQLTPSLFAIFYHSALAKTSHKRADDFSLHFFLGVEIWHVVIFLSLYFIFTTIFVCAPDFIYQIFPWLLTGICFAESVAVFFWYFRPKTKNLKNSTALFISRKSALALASHAEKSRTRTDALLLGFLPGVLEFCFTFPLYLLLVYVSLIAGPPALTLIILYILFSLTPIFFLHGLFKTHHNLAEIQKLRLKLKPIVRLFLTLGFLFLALLTINLGLTNYGL